MKTLLAFFSMGMLFVCHAQADEIYVANTFSNTVTSVDGVTIQPLQDILTGLNPQEIAVSPQGDALYITNATSNEVTVLDPFSQSVKDRISFSCSPSSIAITPKSKDALVVCRSTGQFVILNLELQKQTAVIPVTFPHSVAIHPFGRYAYVSRSMVANYVDVINLVSKSIIGTISTGRSPQGLVVSPDGTRLFVVNSGSGTVSVVDTATNRVRSTISVGSTPHNAVISHDGTKLYVSNYGSGTVSVIDTATSSVANTVGVGVHPHGIAIDSKGKQLYVANYSSNTLSIIDTVTLQTIATIPTGIGPMGIGLAIVDRKLPATVSSLAGSKGVDDFYVSPVIVTLSASDDGSGVKELHYSLDGANEVVTTDNAVKIATNIEGNHTIKYYAVDNAGNAEAAKILTFKIDRTQPAIDILHILPSRNIL